jgi:hypothetical protein
MLIIYSYATNQIHRSENWFCRTLFSKSKSKQLLGNCQHISICDMKTYRGTALLLAAERYLTRFHCTFKVYHIIL